MPLSEVRPTKPGKDVVANLIHKIHPLGANVGRNTANEVVDVTEDTPESAADYVERMKRGFGMQAASLASHDSPASSAVPSGRARSSEPRSNVSPVKGPGLTGARAQSSDPRAAVLFARAAEVADDSDEDESDDDSVAPVGGVAVPWKADVGQVSQERTRSKPRIGSGGGGTGQRKPPRAPPPPAAYAGGTPGEHRRASETEEPLANRKPRIVEYMPATVEEYKQKYGQEVKLGALGPDLDDESLLMKRAVQEKVKQFSKELHRINRQRISAVPMKNQQSKAEPKPTARSKALEFAKELPKPKQKPSSMDKAEKKTLAAELQRSLSEANVDAADWDEIRQREKQHFEDVSKVEQIKLFLSQLPF